MRTFAAGILLTAAIFSTACGATRRVSSVASGPAITNATVQFQDRAHGKDANSGVDVWIVRNGSTEIAHMHNVGVKFADNASIAPLGIPVSGTFYRDDLNDAQMRIRLTPDGRDDWTFEPRLMVTFSDTTSRTYSWPQVTLDNEHPEVTLSFSSAVRNP
jgi:hypothetical protein